MVAPLDALGAAAAILQLVQYGISLSLKATEIVKSKQGLTKETEEVLNMLEKFRSMNSGMIARYDDKSSIPIPGESDLKKTAKDCDSVATDLMKTLNHLQIGLSKNRTRAMIAAIRSDVYRSQIRFHLDRLQALRQVLNEQILRLVSDRTSLIHKEIQQLEQSASTLASDLPKIRNELLDAIKSGHGAEIPDRLAAVQKECEVIMFRRDMLSSLKYEEIRWRWEKIAKPTENTYEWLFEPISTQGPSVQFINWLKNDNGVFWITGKAGSGKSTLMKYISHHPQTEAALRYWAADRRLVTGSHYFWYLGTPMQRSNEGLLQSILYHILRKCPELIDIVCKSRKGDDPASREGRGDSWTNSELLACIKRLANNDIMMGRSRICICLFVDGLDEFSGEHEGVVEILKDIAKSDNIKVCASSRPWEIFQKCFKSSVEKNHHLILQQHTKLDILRFVERELDPSLAGRDHNIESFSDFKSEIVTRADGVFLWVALVIKRELKPGLLWGDSIDELVQRLDRIPRELDDYFKHIFEKIDPFYRKQTARIFLTCMQASEPLPIHVTRLITDNDPRFLAVEAGIDTGYDWESAKLFEEVRRQVNGRCQDLLEVDPPEPWPPRGSNPNPSQRIHRIQFLHRSVEDYLGQTEMWDRLHRRAEADFNADETLLAAYVLLIKRSSSLTDGFPTSLEWSVTALGHAARVPNGPASRALLQELDNALARVQPVQRKDHWTNLFMTQQSIGTATRQGIVTVTTASDATLYERGQRDFLGHLIELGLTAHAGALIASQPGVLSRKQGRPYLDYALRVSPAFRRRSSPPFVPDAEMVGLLLSHGCGAGEKVRIFKDRTVWELYVMYMYEMEVEVEGCKEVAWMLIQHGADDFRCQWAEHSPWETARYRNVIDRQQKKRMSMRELLEAVFGEMEADAMCTAVARNRSKSWASYFRLPW